jgi:signal transduction histidine kinase
MAASARQSLIIFALVIAALLIILPLLSRRLALLLVNPIEQEQKRMEELDRLKTEFLQSVSHDFKTPITSIDGYALDTLTELREETLNIPEMESNLNIIRSANKRLERMVGQLLEVSALESGRIILRKKPLSLSVLLTKAAGDNNGIIIQNGNRAVLEIPDGLPEIAADTDTIERVVTNLISNAARHTRQGTITISLSSNNGMQKVCVTDTGDGIFPGLLKQVFIKYIEREVRVAGSTGLGLYICKQYIDAHGGEMGIESEPGKGTAVWFSLHENDTEAENNE